MTVNTYFTFGQEHKHLLRSRVFDKDTVVLIPHVPHERARYLMFYLFGRKWASQYDDQPPDIKYFKEIVEIAVSVHIAGVKTS